MAARKKMEKEAGIRALISFDGFRKGDELTVPLNDRVLALVESGLVEVLWHGESTSRPRAAQQGDSGGEPQGSEAEGSAGAEQGQNPGPSGHGASAK